MSKKIIFTISIILILVCSRVVYAASDGREFTYDDKGLRDLFEALVTSDGRILPGARVAKVTENIELEGIIWDPKGNSVAILNGKLVKERQRILDIQVLKIKKDSIIIQKKGKVIVVNLQKKRGGKNGDIQ